MKIEIRCTGTENISLDAFTELQGNLKELSNENYAKLKSSLLKYGFCFPVFCWKDGKTFFILDAHQRCKTLKKLRSEGYTIPDLPTVYIEAKDKIEAKELLFQLNSNYGKMTQDGVYEFLNEPGFELLPEILNDVDLPEFDMDLFKGSFMGDGDDSFELADGEKEPFQQITFTLSDVQAETIKRVLGIAKKDNNAETFENENSNGNAIYRVALEWEEQKK